VTQSGRHARPDPSEPAPEQAEPSPEQAEPEVGDARYLKRWTLVRVLIAVWIPAAAIGVGLYYWWFHSLDKTWPVFVVLVFVAVCTVSALLAAMAEGKPVVAAIGVAVMTAPLAAVAAAAVLHGSYFCDRVGHCLVGVIPY
jgi:hypothetical protein